MAFRSQPAGLCAAFRVCVGIPHQDLHGQRRSRVAFNRHIDRPERPGNGREIGGIVDLFVTDEFRPGAVGRVCQVVDRTLTEVMPSARGLLWILPQEGEA
jgi:hypothetical protein